MGYILHTCWSSCNTNASRYNHNSRVTAGLCWTGIVDNIATTQKTPKDLFIVNKRPEGQNIDMGRTRMIHITKIAIWFLSRCQYKILSIWQMVNLISCQQVLYCYWLLIWYCIASPSFSNYVIIKYLFCFNPYTYVNQLNHIITSYHFCTSAIYFLLLFFSFKTFLFFFKKKKNIYIYIYTHTHKTQEYYKTKIYTAFSKR